MCTPTRAYVTFRFSYKHLIFSCLCVWKRNLRIHIWPLPLQASSLRNEPSADTDMSFLHVWQRPEIRAWCGSSRPLDKQSASAPSSCLQRWGGSEGGGRWRQLIERLGNGSLALVLGGRPRLCCRQRRSQPQTEEDDQVTDVEGSRAAARWGVSVPWQLDQAQDQNPEWNKIQICVLLKFQDCLNSAKDFNKNLTMYLSSMSGLLGFTSLCLTWLSHTLRDSDLRHPKLNIERRIPKKIWHCLTWAGEPASWLPHSRGGKAGCGSTTHRTGSVANGWSTCQ